MFLIIAPTCWQACTTRYSPKSDPAQFLKAVVSALPFLLIRTIYMGLNAINLDPTGSNAHTTDFSPMTGLWVLYLVLGLFTELIVIILLAAAGIHNHVRARRDEKQESSHGIVAVTVQPNGLKY